MVRLSGLLWRCRGYRSPGSRRGGLRRRGAARRRARGRGGFRLVWEGAKLALPFTRRGISPEAASTYFLPRLLGHSRASALLLTGGTFSPTSPLLAGLYHSVHPTREEVFPAALALANDLAENTSATTVAATKALLWRGSDSPEGQHLLDSRSLGELAKLTDANEGATAFKERRKPVFKDTLGDMKGWYPWVSTPSVQFPQAAEIALVLSGHRCRS